MSSTKRQGWFASMRRDRVLFAVTGVLVLLIHVFQPLAEARAANTENAWVICTMFGEPKASEDGKANVPAGAADDCPTCIGGPCAGMAAPTLNDPVSVMAFPPLADSRQVLAEIAEKPVPAGRLKEPPPAIRAPPCFA